MVEKAHNNPHAFVYTMMNCGNWVSFCNARLWAVCRHSEYQFWHCYPCWHSFTWTKLLFFWEYLWHVSTFDFVLILEDQLLHVLWSLCIEIRCALFGQNVLTALLPSTPDSETHASHSMQHLSLTTAFAQWNSYMSPFFFF